MEKLILLFLLLIGINGFGQTTSGTSQKHTRNIVSKVYSTAVDDSFSIFVHLPKEHDKRYHKQYPVIYLLDGNYYFDRTARSIDKDVRTGRLPPVILIGIGYKDFSTMDSLRNRDYTYPVALPEYEMGISGGANKFLSFITAQLIPIVERKYNIDTTKRILMGHSLGGYFTLYALSQYLAGHATLFSSYIAASPSLAYNKYYLMGELNKQRSLSPNRGKPGIYISYGSKEGEDPDPGEKTVAETMATLKDYFTGKAAGCVKYKSEVFPGLDHMAAAMPAFGNGLVWALKK